MILDCRRMELRRMVSLNWSSGDLSFVWTAAGLFLHEESATVKLVNGARTKIESLGLTSRLSFGRPAC